MTTSSQLFTRADYDALAAIVFRPDYPGNASARGIVEAPNGDPNARDTAKRYSHVAVKYLMNESRPRRAMLEAYLDEAWCRSLEIAEELNVPYHPTLQTENMFPSWRHGALRVLEYPAGVGGHVHTDMDLFAVNLYRNVPNPGLATLGGREYHMGEIGELVGLGPAEPHHVDPLPERQLSLIYFAIPDHAAVLPSGQTVGEWLAERIKRSRYDAQ